MNSINNINRYNNRNIQFKGFSFARASRLEFLKSNANVTSNILSQDARDIFRLTRNASDKKISFFKILTDRYNKDNFYRPNDIKEDSGFVNKIYKAVKTPNEMHSDLVSHYEGTLSSLYRVFDGIKDKTKRLDFAQKVNREILSTEADSYKNMLPELLESPNSSEYVKNYEKYKAYLKLNRTNPDVVRNLDKMVADGTYNQGKYESIRKYLRIKSKFHLPETENFNSQIYADNYTQEGGKLLDYFTSHFYISTAMLKNGGDKDLLDIYKTTTAENLKVRKGLIKNYSNSIISQHASEEQMAQLTELKKVFDKIDNDEYAMKFVKTITENPVYTLKLSEINNILDNVPTLKLGIFSSNARNIIRQTNSNNQIETLLNEIENPFFETKFAAESRKKAEEYGFASKTHFWDRFLKRLINRIQIMQYQRLSEKAGNSESAKEFIANPLKNPQSLEESKQAAVKKIIDQAEAEKTSPLSEKTVLQEVDSLINSIKETPKAAEDTLQTAEQETAQAPVLTKTQVRQAKKQDLIKNIFDVVSSKLGAKTYIQQKDLFGANATKMRLSMLPEIFGSIADTRNVDRAIGKKRINSSNKDALELYLLLNGNNKKYVNYLLKKRNADNTRMFEVKDIISMVKKAEAKIQQEKKVNPQYRARDARKYYNHLYESKIQQYGKLTRAKKVNTKA